jgi:hypothetical protein
VITPALRRGGRGSRFIPPPQHRAKSIRSPVAHLLVTAIISLPTGDGKS